MPILNYTTKVAVSKTVAEIQGCLVAHGATAVLCEYGDAGEIIALSFKIRVGEQDISFRLPNDWRPVAAILEQNKKVPRYLCNQEQALRVSWRIIKDWVEAQMALVAVRMVKTEQVFLPYVITGDGQTLYERFEKSPQLLLGK
ncbi:MAG: hypothetical protein Q8Q08_12995 [Candidatus Omnitrophota bacterium]|nr:hypothetical protein [Candidatus Omnitrophota bacterium]